MVLQISLDPHDLETLRRRAQRIAGGDLSATVAELLRATKEPAAHNASDAWVGSDWGTPLARKRRRSAQGQ